LITGVLPIRHSVSEQRGGATTIKGTKTHQSRRISLDAQTLALPPSPCSLDTASA
jgi:hypothetical protein